MISPFEFYYRLSEHSEKSIDWLNRSSLTKVEKSITHSAYFKSSDFHGTYLESSDNELEAINEVLIHFLNSLDESAPQGVKQRVLVVGCGFTRIVAKLCLLGRDVHAVDYVSNFLIANALNFLTFPTLDPFDFANHTKHKVGERIQFSLFDFKDMPDDFADEMVFDGALIKNAFITADLPDVYSFLEKAYPWLKPGGVILFRLKHTEHGQAYVIHDGVGTRYYTSWTLEDIAQLKQHLVKIGYTIGTEPRDEVLTEHKDAAEGTPPFYQLVIRKPQ